MRPAKILVLYLGLVLAVPVHAQEASARDRVRRAIERFESALSTTDPETRRRELEGALAELDEANRLESETLIEWNLARVEQELGRPVRALEHVERFLADAPAGHARRLEAEALRAALLTRVATLWVESPVAGARVLIESEVRATLPMSAPIRVAAGEVSVEVSAPGYRTASRRVRVASEAEARVRIDLELEATALGEVRVRCALLDVQITIDDEVRGTTPLEGTAALTPGPHVLIAEREGYLRVRRTIDVEIGAEQTIDLTLEPDPDATLGTLALHLPDARAELTVDGSELDLDDSEGGTALRLPEGRHALELDVEERQDWEGVVTIAAGATTEATPELRWEDVVFGRRHDNAEIQRLTGAAVIGIGSAAAVTGLVLVLHAAIDTSPALSTWNAEDARCFMNPDPSCNIPHRMEIANQVARLSGLEAIEYGVGIPMLLVGAIAVPIGIWLLVDAPSDELLRQRAHASLRLGPSSLVVEGTF